MCALLSQLEGWLPQKFETVVSKCSGAPQAFSAVLRSKLHDVEEVKQWIEEFEEKSHTTWIVRKTKPNAQRYLLRRDYYCQHTSYGKVEERKRSVCRDKNTECEATLMVKVLDLRTEFYLIFYFTEFGLLIFCSMDLTIFNFCL